jgi:hypothetical protein
MNVSALRMGQNPLALRTESAVVRPGLTLGSDIQMFHGPSMSWTPSTTDGGDFPKPLDRDSPTCVAERERTSDRTHSFFPECFDFFPI